MAPISSNRFSVLIFRSTHSYQWLKTSTKLAFSFFLFALLSCNNSQDFELPEDEIDPENEIVELANPALTYRNHCGGCHGQDLASFVERDWTYGNSAEAIIESITDGYANNGMPAYGSSLNAQDIEELTNYILTEIDGKTKAMLEEENPNFI